MKFVYLLIVSLLMSSDLSAQLCTYRDSFTSTNMMVCDTYVVDNHIGPTFLCSGSGYGGNGKYTLFKICTDSNSSCINLDFAPVNLTSHIAVGLWANCVNYTPVGFVHNSGGCINTATGLYTTAGLGLAPDTCYLMAVWTSDTGSFSICRQIAGYADDDSCGGATTVPFVATNYNTSCYTYDAVKEPAPSTFCSTTATAKKTRWFKHWTVHNKGILKA